MGRGHLGFVTVHHKMRSEGWPIAYQHSSLSQHAHKTWRLCCRFLCIILISFLWVNLTFSCVSFFYQRKTKKKWENRNGWQKLRTTKWYILHRCASAAHINAHTYPHTYICIRASRGRERERDREERQSTIERQGCTNIERIQCLYTVIHKYIVDTYLKGLVSMLILQYIAWKLDFHCLFRYYVIML